MFVHVVEKEQFINVNINYVNLKLHFSMCTYVCGCAYEGVWGGVQSF